MILLPQVTIGAAVAGVLSTPFVATRPFTGLLLEAKFLYGAGGTSVKAWVQTRIAGATWRDIACFAFTTAAATKFASVARISVTTALDASDAALADNTAVAGLLGQEFRVKYTSVGTYSGATSLQVSAQVWG